MSLDVSPIPLIAADGLRLGWWRVSDPTVLRKDAQNCFLTHGTFSDRRVCMSAAQAWAERGHVAWILEWRSHGTSEIATQPFDFESVAMLDVIAALHWLREQWPDQKFVAATHSGGGLALLMAFIKEPALQHSFRRLALFACQSHFAGSSVARRGVWRLANLLSRIYGSVPGKQLRLGRCAESYATMACWYRWNIQKSFTGANHDDYGQQLHTIQPAVMSLAAQEDRWIAPAQACLQFWQLLTNPENRFVVCGPSQGFKHRYDHASVMHGRAAKEEVLPVAIDWLLGDKQGD